ncbi:16S rRNA (cytidine(1402)-2'-O)-methyltransferase [Parvularcula marina]|uniref:16S rRNA (cytidine(1402)-2'-O)-methyltransferase n=1 Tax=Parvularcula marina TaxID=2292771 RepID=UPI0035142A91
MTDFSLAPGLYVAATPIGNLGDVTKRLADTLAAADEVLCEDTRISGRLMQALGITAKLRPYHDHNGPQVRPGILAALKDGARIALISDAGTPLISDPGYKLVAEARAQGIQVYTVPGPCAAIAALSIAGVPTDRFSFLGFAPAKQGARQSLLREVMMREETLVFYETGPRLSKMLRDVTEVMGDRPVLIARELTKLHEEVVPGTATSLADIYESQPPKGEIVVVLPPAAAPQPTEEDIDRLMEEALKTLSLKDASEEVAKKTGRSKRDLYQAWLGRTR